VEKKGERNSNIGKKGENKSNEGKLTIFTQAY
jgi:hypothetical protein